MSALGKIQFDAEPEEIVYEKDVKSRFHSDCKEYGTIFFCTTEMDLETYKFAYVNETLYRVQCSCCTRAKAANLLRRVYFEHRNPEKRVDCDSRNHLNYRIHSSYYCKASGKMVIRATRNNDTRVELEFDGCTFSAHHCKDRRYERLRIEDSFEHGAQGLAYAKHHRDASGNPLICLKITHYSKYFEFMDIMDIFCDVDGNIGRYAYNADLQYFELETPFKTRVQPIKRAIQQKLRYDDELLIWYVERCPKLQADVFFGGYRDFEWKTYQFVYNTAYLQFEVVECSSLEFDETKKDANEAREFELLVTRDPVYHREIQFLRDWDGSIRLAERIGDQYVRMEKSPIRVFDCSFEEYTRRQKSLRGLSYFVAENMLKPEEYVVNCLAGSGGTVITFDGHIRKMSEQYELSWTYESQKISPRVVEKPEKFDADDFNISMISEAVEELHAFSAKMTESTLTEPSDDEDYSDAESNATALDYTPSERAIQFYQEVNRMKKESVDDDQASTSTAREPSELSDVSFLEEDDWDTESTATALDFTPSERAILFYKQMNQKVDDDQQSTTTAIEDSDDDVSVVEGEDVEKHTVPADIQQCIVS